MFHKLIEATLGQLARKQQSVTRLFPDFFSNPEKVPGVISKGGVRLEGITEDRWNFKVHSGTEEDLWYDVVIRWKDLKKDVEKLVSDRRNWTKDKKRADLRKIAAKLFKSGNVELECSCPADLYWGKHYIRSQDKYKAKYGEPETRYPEVRNPKLYGAYCKHIQVLMRTLPFYKSTIANWLNKQFKELIQRAEGTATQTAGRYQAAGRALRGRMAKESIQEEVVTAKLPALQQRLLKACKLSGLVKSGYSGEDWLKFWVLNDGTIVPVESSHPESCTAIGSNDVQMMKTGALRGHIDQDKDGQGGLLSIQIRTDPTEAQIGAMKKLAYRFHVDGFTYDDWRKTEEGDGYFGPIKNPEEIEYIVQFGGEGLDEVRKKAKGLQLIREQTNQFFKNAVAKMVRESGLRTKDFRRGSYWLLPDGNAVDLLVECSCDNLLLEKNGCLRVYVDESQNQLQLFGSKPITNEQKSWLRKLIIANQVGVVEAENFNSSEWDEFGPGTPDDLVSDLVTFFEVGDRK